MSWTKRTVLHSVENLKICRSKSMSQALVLHAGYSPSLLFSLCRESSNLAGGKLTKNKMMIYLHSAKYI